MARGGKARSRRQRQRTFGVSAKIDDDADELNPQGNGNNRLAAMQARLKKKADAKSKLEAKIDAEDKSDGGTMGDVIQKLKGLIVVVDMMKEVKKFHSLVDEALEKKLVDSLIDTE